MTVLTEQANFEDAIQESVLPNLDIIVAGPQPPNPPDILDQTGSPACSQLPGGSTIALLLMRRRSAILPMHLCLPRRPDM